MSASKKITNRSIFSERLRKLRGNKSKAAFARVLGIASAVYNRYEDGRLPTADNLSVIADRCSVTTDWLLGREEESEPMMVREAAEPYGAESDRMKRMEDRLSSIETLLVRLLAAETDEGAQGCSERKAG